MGLKWEIIVVIVCAICCFLLLVAAIRKLRARQQPDSAVKAENKLGPQSLTDIRAKSFRHRAQSIKKGTSAEVVPLNASGMKTDILRLAQVPDTVQRIPKLEDEIVAKSNALESADAMDNLLAV